MAAAGTDSVSSARLRPVLLAVTAIGVLAGLAGLLVALTADRADDSEEATRAAVVTTVGDFVSAYNTYDSADLEEYTDRVAPMLTDEFAEQFSTITQAYFPVLAENELSSGNVAVRAVGVEEIGATSATALVAFDSEVSKAGEEGAVQQSFRWVLSLTKADGAWLVSNVANVGQSAAENALQPPAAESEGDEQ